MTVSTQGTMRSDRSASRKTKHNSAGSMQLALRLILAQILAIWCSKRYFETEQYLKTEIRKPGIITI